MFKRLFFTAVGLGAGVALGVYVVRKVDAAQRRMTPEALAASAGARAGSLGARAREAIAEGRAAAAAREAELRATYGVKPASLLVAPERPERPGGAGGVAEWGSPAPSPK